MKKYKLLERAENGLYRIQALQDIPEIGVKAGDIGGYVENEENLSHEGSCWVGGRARVEGDARVGGNARVEGNAWVGGRAVVGGNARVGENAWVEGRAWVEGDARIGENARVGGRAVVGGRAWVEGDARIGENARVGDNMYIYRNAKIKSSSDILCVCGIGSRFDTTTFYRTETGISVTCGCFTGTLDEFKTQVAETHGDNKYAREYKLACQLAELHILGKEG